MLKARQRRFVDEYLVDLNATEAAKRAGYSEKTAWVIGAENLRKPKIAAAIQKAMDERAERTKITQDKVLSELALLGFSDMRDFAKWGADGIDLLSSDDLTPEQSRCVAEIGETTTQHGGSLRFKLHSKPAALELIARHLGMLVDRIQHSGLIETPTSRLTLDERREAIRRILAEQRN